mgnify:CR=1 FL=1|jgi:hypothetical protein|tara:strand:- start:131 stop:289 length:159 start_codon:yes stop_codon:yes gene_type:complete
MIWIILSILIIFWSWCVYEFINTPQMPDNFDNEDWEDEQYFITRKDEEDGLS